MILPEWLIYLTIATTVVVATLIALFLIVLLLEYVFKELIPETWVTIQRIRIRNMPEAVFEKYILALRKEWRTRQIEKQRKEKIKKEE